MAAPNRETVMVRRHSVLVRVTHWINAIAVIVLLMSGLQIFNAHPALYWGEKSVFTDPWLSIEAVQDAQGKVAGLTMVAGRSFDTTGVLGYSGEPLEPRAFPGWATAPGFDSLADGRRWHFFFA